MSLQFRRGIGDSMQARGRSMQHGKPHHVAEREGQPDSREGHARTHPIAVVAAALSVGKGIMSCPRAECEKYACSVR